LFSAEGDATSVDDLTLAVGVSSGKRFYRAVDLREHLAWFLGFLISEYGTSVLFIARRAVDVGRMVEGICFPILRLCDVGYLS